MKRITLPEQLSADLFSAAEQVSLMAPDGRRLGTFIPAKPPFEPDFTEAELRAELASGVKGRQLDDIIRDAKVKYGIHG